MERAVGSQLCPQASPGRASEARVKVILSLDSGVGAAKQLKFDVRTNVYITTGIATFQLRVHNHEETDPFCNGREVAHVHRRCVPLFDLLQSGFSRGVQDR